MLNGIVWFPMHYRRGPITSLRYNVGERQGLSEGWTGPVRYAIEKEFRTFSESFVVGFGPFIKIDFQEIFKRLCGVIKGDYSSLLASTTTSIQASSSRLVRNCFAVSKSVLNNLN